MIVKVNLTITGTIEIDDQTEKVVQTKLDLSQSHSVVAEDELITQNQFFFLSRRGYSVIDLTKMTKYKAGEIIGDIKRKEEEDERRKELEEQKKKLLKEDKSVFTNENPLPWEEARMHIKDSKLCKIDGCEKKVQARGMCSKHYYELYTKKQKGVQHGN